MNRWKLVLALLAVIALIAAACGDSDEDAASTDSTAESEDTTGTTGTESTEATDGTETTSGSGSGTAAPVECDTTDSVSVTLQWLTQAQFAGYFAARDKGFYEEFCLDVEIVEGGIDIIPQQQVASGASDFGLAWVPKALVTREEGADVVNVAQVFQRSATLQVAFADSGIDGPEDFAGKNIGNWGGGNEFELVAGARSAGLEPGSDFEFVQQDFTMTAFISGEIDAAQAMTYNEYAQVLETVNPETGELFQPEDLSVIDWNEVGTAMLQDGIWTDGARLESDPEWADVTTRFVAASIKGWAFCRDNFDECVQIVLDNGSALGASHQAWQLNEINALIWPSPGGAGIMDQALWDQTVEIATNENVLSAPPDEGAYTSEYAEAARALLEAQDVDVTGEGFTKTTVTLNEGGT